jgi:CcmD family protein
MSDMAMLVAAYALVWVFVFGYLVWLASRQEKLRRDVEALRGALKGRERHAGGS